MIRVPCLSWVLVLTAALCAGAPPASARVEFLSLRCASLGGARKDCRVYLPPSYDRPAAREQRYPVIFFLHGWPGSEGNWPGQGHALETLDQMSGAGLIPEVIALFPDGGGDGLLGRSLWIDAAGGRNNMEDYLVHDLVAWADSSFRTRREARCRGAIGLSDGATAAMNLVLRHPDVFRACGAHSGDFRLKKDLSNKRIFGDEPGASRLRTEYSPLDYLPEVAANLGDSSIYFDCGADDGSISDNRELHALMTRLGVPHVYRELPGGHDWGYWRRQLRHSLTTVTSKMR